MGYIYDNIIEFHGETFKALCSDRESYVSVNGVRHDILPKTLFKFKNCSTGKEYVEAIEYFAYLVLIKKSILMMDILQNSKSPFTDQSLKYTFDTRISQYI